ncbi:MAG: triphosphoribosyl-dephospho-CoA synthase [Planctomycetaceae bacterium]|nr:triphosphoribosyl-dephospho-CoA synthase [Planctomycetaceae bacterium]
MSVLPRLSLNTLSGQLEAACLLEAAARKPGNVHPGAAFADLTFADFVTSATAAAPRLAQARESGVGQAVFNAVESTQAAVGRNTNLGIILLLAPLAAVPPDQSLQSGIGEVLRGLTVADSRLVYAAIRAAQPGGMGTSNAQDLAGEPTLPLVEIMRLAADRDTIARQYATDYADLFEVALPGLLRWSKRTMDWEQIVIGTYLDLLSTIPDSLITRKSGEDRAREAGERAAAVLAAGWPITDLGQQHLEEFDQWLRGDGHRRNPGTTADMIAATLFIAIRDKLWLPPDLIES